MTAKEYKEKAERLLNDYLDSKSDECSFSENEKHIEVKDEFLHLVFFFNPKLPMLREMQEISSYPQLTKYDREPEKYMHRFIRYLNEYCIDDSNEWSNTL